MTTVSEKNPVLDFRFLADYHLQLKNLMGQRNRKDLRHRRVLTKACGQGVGVVR